MEEINFFGTTNFRNTQRKFGIKIDDRRRHFYAIGKTGMGKTEMLKNMAVQDIRNGFGIGFVDPHGEAVEDLLDFVPKERVQDVVYFNPADTRFPLAFNVMEQVDPEKRHMVASGLMSVFKKIWPDVWSARMEYILNNVVLALLEYPGSTLLGINRMLADQEYRAEVIEHVKDPVVKTFWVQEYARYTQRYEVEATAAIQNKVGQFISNPLIRNIIGQERSSVDMRELMDSKKILLVNISKGRIGEDNSRLLGGLLITKLQLAAMSRVDILEEARNDFFLYIDEFQNFATESFVNILSEARKYRLCLILSHQYIMQLDETVRDAVFGNVGTLVSFRIGAEDAEVLEKEFSPEFLQADFVNLGKYTIYVKLMIDGITSRPFSAQTLPPPVKQTEPQREAIIDFSRKSYGTPQQEVEEHISKWSGTEEGIVVPTAQNNPTASGEPPVLYDARCSNCGKDTKVVFPPDGKRPVYCKACRKKLMRDRKPTEEASPGQEGQEERKESQRHKEPAPSEATPAHAPQENAAADQRQPNPSAGRPPAPPEVREKKEKESVSLSQLVAREAQSPQARQNQSAGRGKQQGRKQVEREGLQQVLRQALEKKPAAAGKQQQEGVHEERKAAPPKGVLKPGETLYFE